MKVLFTASIAQKDKYGKYYKRIFQYLEKEGFVVESGNLFRMDVESIAEASEEDRLKWYNRSLRNISRSDLVVVEISFPSTVNIGHELSIALEKGKPVIALYHKDNDPIFLRGKEKEKLIIVPYDDDDLEQVLKDAVEYATGKADTRFNFFISRRLSSYLDWIAKNRRIPRAVYLRQLISREMRKHRDFLEGS